MTEQSMSMLMDSKGTMEVLNMKLTNTLKAIENENCDTIRFLLKGMINEQESHLRFINKILEGEI